MIASRKTFSEKRQHARVNNNIPLKVCHSDGDMVTETLNISKSGAYCRVDKYIEPMVKVKIQLLLPVKTASSKNTKKVSCNGVVVRIEPIKNSNDYNIAIFFNEISKKDINSIEEYVNSFSE